MAKIVLITGESFEVNETKKELDNVYTISDIAEVNLQIKATSIRGGLRRETIECIPATFVKQNIIYYY